MIEHKLSPPAAAATPITTLQADSLVAKLGPARQAVAITIQTGEAALLLDSLAANTPAHREKQDEIAHVGTLLLREQAARDVPDATLCRHMARSFLRGRRPIDAKLGVLCLLLAQDHAQALEAALQACADESLRDDTDPHIIHAIVASAALGRPAGELPGLRHQLYVLEVEVLAAALAPLPPEALAAIASTLEPLSAVALFVWMRATPWPAVLIALARLPERLILAEEMPQMHTATDAVRQQLLARVLLRGMAVPAALHAVENSLRLGGDVAALRADPFLRPLGDYPEYRWILMP